MLDRFRALATVIEEGSVNRAASRLRISQPALSKQMKAMEFELGGKLLERESSGVKPTGLCHDALATMLPILTSYEQALAILKRKARGDKSELRVGFLISAARPLLTPALDAFRKIHPAMKLTLHDMSPREQIDALRAGEIDVALVGQEGQAASRDFYCRTLCSMGVCAALSISDPLASRAGIELRSFKGRDFIGVDQDQVPGRNQWMIALCRTAGFKPRFITSCDGIHNVLSLVVSEMATTFLPAYFRDFSHPGATFVPIFDKKARWDFIVLWQRGKVSREVWDFVEALSEVSKAI